MTFTKICLIVMLLLFKFSTIDKWWLSYFIILTVAALFGHPVDMIGMVITMGVWKVIKDIFSHR